MSKNMDAEVNNEVYYGIIPVFKNEKLYNGWIFLSSYLEFQLLHGVILMVTLALQWACTGCIKYLAPFL